MEKIVNLQELKAFEAGYTKGQQDRIQQTVDIITILYNKHKLEPDGNSKILMGILADFNVSLNQ